MKQKGSTLCRREESTLQPIHDERIIAHVSLEPKHIVTHQVRHYRNGLLLGKPNALKIIQFPEDPGFYLIYIDNEGSEMTDTYHDTLPDALEQAWFEFQVDKSDWIFV